jgi:hypothetical protein
MSYRAILILLTLCFLSCHRQTRDIITVKPGDDIQSIIDNGVKAGAKTFLFEPGLYKPNKSGPALIYLHKAHTGITLKAKGEVILSSANEQVSDEKTNPFHPDIVNHIVYFGTGIKDRTVFDGFILEGSNGYVTTKDADKAEPNGYWKKSFIYYADGGAIKIWGKSYPTLQNLIIRNNKVILCGAGISIEQTGRAKKPVTIDNVHFINNQANLTGAAVDLLPGSWAKITNSHFEGNSTESLMSQFPDYLKEEFPHPKGVVHSDVLTNKGIFDQSAAVTVFKNSSLEISNSTFKDNQRSIDYIPYIKWYTRRTNSDAVRERIKNTPTNIKVVNNTFENKSNSKNVESYHLKLRNKGKAERNTFQ